jgi:hypothetical protein
VSDDFRAQRVSIQIPATPAPSRWERFRGWLASSWRTRWWRTADFALLAGVALAIWFGGGDPTLTYGAFAFGVFFAAAGLFTSIPNRLAICAFIVVILFLFGECKFVIEHARRNESSVPTGPAPMTTPPTPSGPATTPPESAPNAPPAANPSGPISPQDAATQLAAWESVRSNRDGLVEAYNLLDGTLKNWESFMDDAGGRKSFTDGMHNVTDRLKHWFPRLDSLKNEYPQFQDLTAAMADSHVDQVLEKAGALVDAVADSRQETNEARVLRLRPLEGALRAEMGGMVNWLTALGRTSEQRIHDLSGVK